MKYLIGLLVIAFSLYLSKPSHASSTVYKSIEYDCDKFSTNYGQLLSYKLSKDGIYDVNKINSLKVEIADTITFITGLNNKLLKTDYNAIGFSIKAICDKYLKDSENLYLYQISQSLYPISSEELLNKIIGSSASRESIAAIRENFFVYKDKMNPLRQPSAVWLENFANWSGNKVIDYVYESGDPAAIGEIESKGYKKRKVDRIILNSLALYFTGLNAKRFLAEIKIVDDKLILPADILVLSETLPDIITEVGPTLLKFEEIELNKVLSNFYNSRKNTPLFKKTNI